MILFLGFIFVRTHPSSVQIASFLLPEAGIHPLFCYFNLETIIGRIPDFSGVSDRKNDVILTYAYQEYDKNKREIDGIFEMYRTVG